MSRIKIFSYLLAIIIQSHCTRVNLDKTGDHNTSSYLSDDGDIYYKGGIYDIEDKGQATTSKIGDVGERTEVTVALIQTKKWVPYARTRTLDLAALPVRSADVIARIQEQIAKNRAKSQPDVMKTKRRVPQPRNFSVGLDIVPARRTDVIAQLQEQRARHGAKAFQLNDINYELPGEIWPAITFRIPKVLTAFTLPTPPSKPTRTFRDHFQSIRVDFRTKYTPNFLSTKRSLGLSATRDIATFSNFLWKYKNVLNAQPTWYAVYRTVPCTKLPGLTNIPGLLTETSLSNTVLRKSHVTASNTSNALEVGEIDYFLQDEYEKDLKRYYEHYDDVRKGVMLAVPGEPDIMRQEDKQLSEKKETTTTTVTTTTTTTRTTRTYPRPTWICYECGRNETKFGSSFCQSVFDTQNSHLSGKRRTLRYRCNGNDSVAYQCFKRFVDIGDYNERGCRNWPPRHSGKTYASKRLRALERMLKDTNDGCVFTPQAFLLSFSRTVQLYVRFHACVCEGTLCNDVSSISAGPWLFLFTIASITATISGRL